MDTDYTEQPYIPSSMFAMSVWTILITLYMFSIGSATVAPNTEALQAIVRIITEATVLHEEADVCIRKQFSGNGFVVANRLSGYKMYRQVFENFLEPTFTARHINDTALAWGVAEEAVSGAAEYTFGIFDSLLEAFRMAESPNAASVLETRTRLSTRWSGLQADLQALRLQYVIPELPLLLKTRADIMQEQTTKLFEQFLALFESVRNLLQESFTAIGTFHAWTAIMREDFSRIAGPEGEVAIETAMMEVLEDFHSVRAMIVHEDLTSMNEDTGEFETMIKLITSRMFTLLSTFGLSGNETTSTEFLKMKNSLKTVLCPSWKRMSVSASVLHARVNSQLLKTTGGGLSQSTVPPAAEGAKTLVLTIDTTGKKRRGKNIPPESPSPMLDPEEREKAFNELMAFAGMDEERSATPPTVVRPKQRTTVPTLTCTTSTMPPETTQEMVSVAVVVSATEDSGEFQPVLSKTQQRLNRKQSIRPSDNGMGTPLVKEPELVPVHEESPKEESGDAHALVSRRKQRPKRNHQPRPVDVANDTGDAPSTHPVSVTNQTVNHIRDEGVSDARGQDDMGEQVSEEASPFESAEQVQERQSSERGRLRRGRARRSTSDVRNPHFEYCLMRMSFLATQSRILHDEMMYLCNEVGQGFWSSGNIPGGQIAGGIYQNAFASYGNAVNLEGLASNALWTHYYEQ